MVSSRRQVFWEILVAGSDNVSSRSIVRLMDAQKLGPGRWQKHHATSLEGNVIELFLGKDKSKKQVREEVFLKKARKIVESHVKSDSSVFAIKPRGVVSVQWQDLPQLSAPTEEGKPLLRWKAGLLVELELDKSQLEDEFFAVCAPRHRQEPWDG